MQFPVDGNTLGNAVTLNNGSATSVTTSNLSVGTHTVTAAYTPANSNNYSASTGTLPGGRSPLPRHPLPRPDRRRRLRDEVDGTTDTARWFRRDELGDVRLVEIAQFGVDLAFDRDANEARA